MKNHKRLLCFLIAIYTSNELSAQIVHAGLWTGYLDGIGIHSMVQQDSFLYISTVNGTAFVNTQTRKTRFFYDFGNPDLPIRVDLKISTVDKQGCLWTFINQQLARITPSGNIQYVGGVPDYQVLTLKADQTGQIWAGMVTEPINNPATSKCLAKFTNTGWESVDFGQTRMNIRDIAFDALNQPFVIANSVYNPSGVFQFNGTGFVKIPGSSSLFKLAVSSDGQIANCGDGCCGTVLKLYKDGVWTTYGQLNTNIPPDFCLPDFDANNVLWVGHGAGSVYTLKNNSLELQLSPPANYRTGPSDEVTISGFSLDYQGNMWLGKLDGLFTASVEQPHEWDFVQTADLLLPESPNSIAVFKDTVWLGNNDGVTRLINGNWEKLDYPANPRPSLFYDTLRQGLWVGATGLVLDFYQGTNHIHFDLSAYTNTSYPFVDGITSDLKGNIWIRTPKLLLRYDLAGNWKAFKCGEAFSDYFLIGQMCAKDNFMYVTVGGQYPWLPNITHDTLYKIEGDILTRLNIPEALLKNVNSFSIISDQDIWFDASSKIIHYKNGQTQEYTASDLGGNLNWQSIVPYNDSIIMVCSNEGLYLFKQGKWYYPKIPSNRIANNYAEIWNISADHKFYMGHSPLMVLEDIDALLEQLEPLQPVMPGSDLSTLVYPNPVSRFLNMDKIIAALGTELKIYLYNTSGQLVKVFDAPTPYLLDLSQYPAGIYFLSIKSGNQPIFKCLSIIKL